MTPDAPQTRVLLVDDEQLMRAGLRLMIDGADGISVVGEAADGEEALERCAELAPDVVLMDIRMPRMDGIEATRALRERGDGPGVVVLTAFDTDTFLLDALRAGAMSFLLKDSPPEQVVQSIHEAARGDARFSPAVLQRLVRLASAHDNASPALSGDRPTTGSAHGARTSTAESADAADGSGTGAVAGPPHGLTEREWEVAGLVAQGLTNSEIADALFLSLPTIKTHIGHLFEKLLVTNRVQLAIRVLELDARA